MKVAPLILAGLVVLSAFGLRLAHCAEGLPYLHIWDEPQTASAALLMMKTGDFNPHFFNYGSLMIYLTLLVDCVHALSLLGAPPRPGASLNAVGEVLVNADTGWHWAISHPSFYFWDRALVAAMGAGTVALVAAIGRRLVGWPAALIAATLLAATPAHLHESSRVTNDAPVAFLVTLTAWCALCFAEGRGAAWLKGALVAAGLAISCKYNAGVALVLPLAALIRVRWRQPERADPWLWPALLWIPALAFLLTTPYSLLDLPQFLNQVGYELRHYQVLGHGVSTVTPGWPHLTLQAGEVYDNLGPLPCLAAAVGVPFALRRRAGWLVLLFPVLYTTYMCNTKVSFPRNFLVLYPFLCLSAAFAVDALAARLTGRARAVAGGLALGGGLFWLARAVPAAQAALVPETRSEIVTQLAAGPWTRVGVPEELRVHAVDLARLRGKDVQVAPLEALLCGSDREVVVVPVSFRSAAEPLRAEHLNALLPPLSAVLAHGARGRGEFLLDEPAINPQLRLVPAAAGCLAWREPAAALDAPAAYTLREGALFAPVSGAVTTGPRALSAGRWRIRWLLRGTRAGGEGPVVRLSAVGPEGALAEVEAHPGADWGPADLDLDVSAPTELQFRLDYLNDAVIDGQDRNLELLGLIGAPRTASPPD